jgi:hypothetical protein
LEKYRTRAGTASAIANATGNDAIEKAYLRKRPSVDLTEPLEEHRDSEKFNAGNCEMCNGPNDE